MYHIQRLGHLGMNAAFHSLESLYSLRVALSKRAARGRTLQALRFVLSASWASMAMVWQCSERLCPGSCCGLWGFAPVVFDGAEAFLLVAKGKGVLQRRTGEPTEADKKTVWLAVVPRSSKNRCKFIAAFTHFYH